MGAFGATFQWESAKIGKMHTDFKNTVSFVVLVFVDYLVHVCTQFYLLCVLRWNKGECIFLDSHLCSSG